MRKRSILLVAGALAILATLVVGPATAGSERASAGTVVIVHDQEPQRRPYVTSTRQAS